MVARSDHRKNKACVVRPALGLKWCDGSVELSTAAVIGDYTHRLISTEMIHYCVCAVCLLQTVGSSASQSVRPGRRLGISRTARPLVGRLLANMSACMQSDQARGGSHHS